MSVSTATYFYYALQGRLRDKGMEQNINGRSNAVVETKEDDGEANQMRSRAACTTT